MILQAQTEEFCLGSPNAQRYRLIAAEVHYWVGFLCDLTILPYNLFLQATGLLRRGHRRGMGGVEGRHV